MKTSGSRSFVRVLATLACGILGAVGLFNLVVDPFDLVRWVRIDGFNAQKPAVGEHQRMVNAYRIREVRPRGLILGTSRAECGLRADHPVWSGDASPCFNAGMPDGNPYEMRRYFQHAMAVQPVRRIVVGLDFYPFNVFFQNRPDFDDRRLAVDAAGRRQQPPLDEEMAMLFSFDALLNAVATVSGQHATGDDLAKTHGQKAVFLMTEHEYAHYKWRNPGRPPFALSDRATGASRLDEFRSLVRLARAGNVDARFFISPCHARLLEALAACGLWEEFERWKTELVRVMHEEGDPYPLWDFSGFNSITSEAVPAYGDMTKRMKGYLDASHYSPATGDMILDRMFEQRESGPGIPVDFGMRLLPASINASLERVRREKETYEQQHPSDMLEAKAIVRERSKAGNTEAILQDLVGRFAAATAP